MSISLHHIMKPPKYAIGYVKLVNKTMLLTSIHTVSEPSLPLLSCDEAVSIFASCFLLLAQKKNAYNGLEKKIASGGRDPISPPTPTPPKKAKTRKWWLGKWWQLTQHHYAGEKKQQQERWNQERMRGNHKQHKTFIFFLFNDGNVILARTSYDNFFI